MRVGRQVSPSFSVSHGESQGSVLSPTLFLLVMDPILLELSKRSCAPPVCGLYLGSFSHANDIQTLSTNISASDVESLVITRQCRLLEFIYKSNYMTSVLTAFEETSYITLPEERNSPTPCLYYLQMPLHIPLGSMSKLLHPVIMGAG